MEVQEIRNALSDGLLSFPITDMDGNGRFNKASYIQRLEWILSKEITAVFTPGGTGEFFSLSQDEYSLIVQTAVEIVNGRLPVISSVGRSIAEAIAFAKIAEQAGIDALLLMPPYLTSCPAEGAMAYAKAIMDNTRLPVIYYNRSNGILATQQIKQLADQCPNLIGVKDGTGDIQALNDLIKTLGDRLVYIGGVPTAEIISEAYLAIGVNTYSSAVFNFVPDLAISYYKALRAVNKQLVQTILKEFFIPFVRLRSKQKGYAVSLIKEGANLIGRSGGDVRPPLVMPNKEESEQLRSLIVKAESLSG